MPFTVCLLLPPLRLCVSSFVAPHSLVFNTWNCVHISNLTAYSCKQTWRDTHRSGRGRQQGSQLGGGCCRRRSRHLDHGRRVQRQRRRCDPAVAVDSSVGDRNELVERQDAVPVGVESARATRTTAAAADQQRTVVDINAAFNRGFTLPDTFYRSKRPLAASLTELDTHRAMDTKLHF